jgi:tRNA-dihydrouridine synthase C
MRLGNEHDGRALECALAIAEGGAGELVVHARTKVDGYRPPAYWERIAAIREALAIPVVANGEIWTVADALRCRERSGCDSLMLGRGMVADPGLALAIRAKDAAPGSAADDGPAVPWRQVFPLLSDFWHLLGARLEARHRSGRLKQWLNLLRRRYPEAEAAYAAIRPINDPPAVARCLFGDSVGALAA